MNELCDKCGKYTRSDESVLQLNVDNDLEVICNDCLAAEESLSKRSNVLRMAKYVSNAIVNPERSQIASTLLQCFSR